MKTGFSEEHVQRFWDLVDKRDPQSCWEWRGRRDPTGYGRFNCGDKRHIASRVSLSLSLGREIAPGVFACHHCDNPPCVNPAHLFEGSPKENAMDSINKGRARYKRHPGEENGRARLTAANVIEIRFRAGAGEHHINLAREFRVHPTTIFQAVHRMTWKHL